MDTMRPDERDGFYQDFVRGEPGSLITDLIKLGVILKWPDQNPTTLDDKDNCFLPFDSKDPLRYDTVNNDIDDDSATKHSDSLTRNSHRQSV